MIHPRTVPTGKDPKRLIYLQQLEGTAGSPSLLLGTPVVDVTLVLAALAHGRTRTGMVR
jgi:hypothetical protein